MGRTGCPFLDFYLQAVIKVLPHLTRLLQMIAGIFVIGPSEHCSHTSSPASSCRTPVIEYVAAFRVCLPQKFDYNGWDFIRIFPHWDLFYVTPVFFPSAVYVYIQGSAAAAADSSTRLCRKTGIYFHLFTITPMCVYACVCVIVMQECVTPL